MSEAEPVRQNGLPQTLAPGRTGARAWQKFKLVLSRAIFWSYERGSWQYDIICAVILCFIFLTPRAWFHDGPTLELSDLRHRQGVIEIGRKSAGSEYLVDSRLVESLAPLPLHDAVRTILEGRLKRSVNIKSLEAVRDKNNVVLGYTVVISP